MFNRPFDDQKQIRIRLESEAKLYLQEPIKVGNLKLVWSYMMDFENEQNPFAERREAIKRWKKWALVDVSETAALLDQANRLITLGLNGKDALHVASAIEGQAQYFLTTDDKMMKKLLGFNKIQVISPIEFIKVFDNDNGY
ncbi:hypothetical protein THII_3636 [Thioploca ingrica]|uniref:PIN domain-containing protein n=1 Tax=Thioploca ingrica TaxID=40754 RepID=A0A090AHT8_9GAMM|nr:hypothetical protein THII_3636 [Thioploca ingrica]